MKGILLSFLLLPFLAQETDLDRLIRRLADDDVAVRDGAARSLREAGPSAIQALRKAEQSGDPELASRARLALLEIERAENRKSGLGLTTCVTFEDGEWSLADIAVIVRRQTSVALEFPSTCLHDRVKLSASRMLFWEFLDLVCSTHGGLRLAEGQPEACVKLERGKPGRGPVLISGGFRIILERVRWERTRRLGMDQEHLTLVAVARWLPGMRPFGHPDLRIDQVTGTDGRDLAPTRIRMGGSHGGGGYRMDAAMADLEAPPGLRQLKLIKGHLDLTLPSLIRPATFEKPVDAVGQERRAGEYGLKLLSYESDGTGKRAKLTGSRNGWGNRIRDVVLVDSQGREHRGEVPFHLNEPELVFGFPKEAPSDRLEVRYITETHNERVEFEFRDVDLP